MNRLLKLILLDLKLLSKTKVFYFKLILFPTALILILGTAFANQDSSKPVSKFQVGFYSEDSAIVQGSQKFSLGETLKDDVLSSKDAKSYFTLEKVSCYAEGKKLVNDKKISAFVYVPNNFTKAYINGTKADISLVGDNSKEVNKMIVKNILDRFNQSIRTIRIEENEVSLNASPSNRNLEKIIAKIQSTSSYSDEISKVSTNKNAKPISIMAYEAIAITVMFSILTSFELAHGIVSDKLNSTQFRIKTTPTLDIEYALGKVFGMILAITIQMSIIILISHVAFGINWGNLVYILAITLSYGFAVGSMIFCAGAAAKDQMSISSFAPAILWGLSFLGGSLVSKNSFPDILQKIQQIVPNGKAINCYLKVCQGGSFSDIYLDLIELLGLGLVFIIISLHFYRDKSSTKLVNKGGHENANSDNDKKPIEAAV